ncbi:MAG TPA: WD40 repeat domain-containing protein [Caulobacteraceae bacterium]|nr:WD40 repeat domain-containing protein [Caulobacteraceae bacterium]
MNAFDAPRFDAYVTEIVADSGRAAFALGEGVVAWEDGARVQAHDGAILAAVAHPSGQGVVTGGDDGRLVWSRPHDIRVLAEVPRKWVDAVAAAPVSGLIAFAAGREVHVLDVKAPDFRRVFSHDASVAALAFDPKGRRLATATYGGAALWYARIAEQKPVMLRWAGSHVALAFSPDGRFLISSMQEAALHGWRLSDARDMRMGGYPAKVRSLVFLGDAWLATSGANGAVLWPFAGSNGPMGKQAMELGWDESALVTRVAGDPRGETLVVGLDDGRIWASHLPSERRVTLRAEKGPPISALTVVGHDRVAWGDEEGGAGVLGLEGG